MTGMNDSQITYLRLLGSNLFSRQKISEEEEDHESDENAEIPPQMRLLVLVADADIFCSVYNGRSRGGTTGIAQDVVAGCVRVGRPGRDERTARILSPIELVDHETLEGVG